MVSGQEREKTSHLMIQSGIHQRVNGQIRKAFAQAIFPKVPNFRDLGALSQETDKKGVKKVKEFLEFIIWSAE
jgi:hypothetical protein